MAATPPEEVLRPGHKTEQPCPKCGTPMVVRQNGATGGTFLGCARYPECKGTQEIPLSLRLRAAGAQQFDLFGDAGTQRKGDER